MIKQLQADIKTVKENEKKQRVVVDTETKALEDLRKSLQEQQVRFNQHVVNALLKRILGGAREPEKSASRPEESAERLHV